MNSRESEGPFWVMGQERGSRCRIKSALKYSTLLFLATLVWAFYFILLGQRALSCQDKCNRLEGSPGQWVVVRNVSEEELVRLYFEGVGDFADIEFVEGNLGKLDQEDRRLIRYVRARYLQPPSQKYSGSREANLTEFGAWANAFFDKRNGVFIEAGANDGGRRGRSHTLDLELNWGWTGILIECNPTLVPDLRSLNRNAWVAGVCISTSKHHETVSFAYPDKRSESGRIGNNSSLIGVQTNWTSVEVEALPLYTLLAATGIKEIDFFVFDVEGLELNILTHFPFHRIPIKVLVIQVGLGKTAKDIEDLRIFMVSKGYRMAQKKPLDHIFIRKDLPTPKS